jgi:hypothetical protein
MLAKTFDGKHTSLLVDFTQQSVVVNTSKETKVLQYRTQDLGTP